MASTDFLNIYDLRDISWNRGISCSLWNFLQYSVSFWFKTQYFSSFGIGVTQGYRSLSTVLFNP